jgi:hypothetical protein
MRFRKQKAHLFKMTPLCKCWIVTLLSECELVDGDMPAASEQREPLLERSNNLADHLLIFRAGTVLERDLGKAAVLIEPTHCATRLLKRSSLIWRAETMQTGRCLEKGKRKQRAENETGRR